MRLSLLAAGLALGCSPKDESGSGGLGSQSEDTAVEDSPHGAANRAPSAPEISLVPSQPDTTDDLVVNIDVPGSDPDGDAVEYVYSWSRDGDARDDVEADSVGSVFTRRGETWTVQVQATDGWKQSDPVSAEVVIENSLPTISEIRIEPEEIYEATEVTCQVGDTDDVDHDPVLARQVWVVDGTEIDREGPLTGDDFDKDQTLRCRVYLYDDVDPEFAVDSDPVTVLNTAPNVVGVDLEPEYPRVDQNIIAIPIGWYDEDDDAEEYLYTWYVNFVEAGDGEALSSEMTSPGDNVYLELRAFDGTDAGNMVTSRFLTVENETDDPTD